MKKVKKILLINPPGRCMIGRDGKINERKHCHPHLGLAYLAASLLKFDYEVEVIDMLAEGYEQERYTEHFVFYGLSFDETIERIRKSNPDVIGVSVLFSNLALEAYRLVKALKAAFPDKPIVLGGHHPSAAPLHVMKNQDVDFVLTGESDLTMVELCDALNGKGELLSIRGLYWRKDGQVMDNTSHVTPIVQGKEFKYFTSKDSSNPQKVMELPLPAWHLLPMEKYMSSTVRSGAGDVQRERYAVMVSTRGCPHTCYFCTSPLMGGYKNYRQRTNEDVIREIRWLKEEYGIKEVAFLDDNFFVSAPRVKQLCPMLAQEFPDMVFSVPSGAEINALDEEMIDLLAKANFHRLILAIESGSQDIQNGLIDKKVKLDRVPKVIQYIKSKGIEVRGFFMIGFPGEKRASMEATAKFALSLDLDDFAISIVTPLPGTPLHDECLDKGILVEDFDSDDIRYGVSSIKIDDMTPEEVEGLRREMWLANWERKIEADKKKAQKDVHFKFHNPADFATAGFGDKERLGY